MPTEWIILTKKSISWTRQKQIEEEMAANGDNYAKLAELQKELMGSKAWQKPHAKYLSELGRIGGSNQEPVSRR